MRQQQLDEASFDPEGSELEPFPPEWAQPERVVAMREAEGEDGEERGVEYLIKWRMLPYSDATWERSADVEVTLEGVEHPRVRVVMGDGWLLRGISRGSRGRDIAPSHVRDNG